MSFRIQSFRQAAFWSTVINGFSQGLALLFSMLMAALFGAQESTDILYYGLGVIALLSGVLQSASIGVLIPETMRRRHQIGETDAMAFINRFLIAMGIPIVLATLVLLWHPVDALALVSRFSVEALTANSKLIYWLVLSFPLQMMAQLLLNVLVSYRYLTLPATLSCVSRATNLLFVWLFYKRWGVESFAIGLVAGCLIQLAVNVGLLIRVVGWQFRAWDTDIGRKTYQNIAWVELGTLAGLLASYLPLFLFSGFSAGALTALNYARRMSAMPAELLSSQISSVTAIKFNEQAARRDLVGMSRSFDRIQRLLIMILAPLAFMLALAGKPLIQILFGRGEFGAEAVVNTAWLFSVLILTLPLEALNSVVARMNIARQEVAFGTGWQIVGNTLNALLVFVFVRRMGAIGFPVASCTFFVLYLLILTRPFSIRMAPASLWPTMKYLALTTGACTAAAAAAWASVGWLLPVGAGPWSEGLALVGAFAVVYTGILCYLPPDLEVRDEGLAWIRATIRPVFSKSR